MDRSEMLMLVALMVSAEADALYYGECTLPASRAEAEELYALAQQINADVSEGQSQEALDAKWANAKAWWETVP